MNTPERIFLGWDRPAIELVAHRLLEGLRNPQTAAQYRRATVVVPTAESGRRLREYMAEKAGKALLMPRITLAGQLLTTGDSRIATEEETLAAWLKVLGASMGDKSLSWLLDVATQMQRVRKQLEQEARSPEWDDAAARDFVREYLHEPDEAWERTLLYEQERWQTLRAAFAGVDAQLAQWERIPAEQARADELEKPRARGLLIIACIPELSPLNRLYLQRLTDTNQAQVEIWVNAPSAESTRFDTYGQPLPVITVGPSAGMGWCECPITIPRQPHADESAACINATEVIHTTGSPAAFGLKVRELAGGCDSDEVVLASCDSSLSPMLVSAFQPEWQINMPEGRSLLATEAGRLPLQLRDACSALHSEEPFTSSMMEDFLTLLRNHTLQSILEPARKLRSFNRFLTELCFQHLPGSPGHLCHLMQRMKGTVHSPSSPWTLSQIRDFLRYTESVTTLVQDCNSTKKLPFCLKKLADALQYQLSAPEVRQAGQHLAQLLRRIAALVESPVISCSPPAALALLAYLTEKQAGGLLEGAGERGKAIDLRGWRELSFAGEARLIIAGMHDGCVPERLPADAYLPQAYRAFQGMTSDTTRTARDSFLLTALLHSRPARAVHFVLASSSADGTPIAPSPLLLRCNTPAETAERVNWLFADSQKLSSSAAYDQLPFITPEHCILPGMGMEPADLIAPGIPNPYANPEKTFSPSAIKDFLTCPLRFWLKKLLKVSPGDALEDGKSEPDAAEYGTLLHAILQDITTRYAHAEESVPPDALSREIELYAAECTAERVSEQYRYETSSLPAPISILQKNLLKTTQAFARIHAADICAGWEVIMREEQLVFELPMENGAPPLRFDMRVDRVDRHRDGRMRVIDYKTNTADPRKTHWEKLSEAAAGLYHHYMPEALILRNQKEEMLRWSSVQLPLYAEALCHQFHLQELPETAFYNMPRTNPGEVSYNIMSGVDAKSCMTPALHRQAMECVKAAAELMRAGLCLYSAESLGRNLSYDGFGSLCIYKDPDPRVMCSLPPLNMPGSDN
ncbi:MAG: hypothetical protein E7032_09785 [Akkermansiaceae bacterium]|nr:hypothetical protein [Akkermansiaceae bacterium]